MIPLLKFFAKLNFDHVTLPLPFGLLWKCNTGMWLKNVHFNMSFTFPLYLFQPFIIWLRIKFFFKMKKKNQEPGFKLWFPWNFSTLYLIMLSACFPAGKGVKFDVLWKADLVKTSLKVSRVLRFRSNFFLQNSYRDIVIKITFILPFTKEEGVEIVITIFERSWFFCQLTQLRKPMALRLIIFERLIRVSNFFR